MFSSAFVYPFLFVCLFVSRIMQKLLNRLSQNSVERWHMGHERNQKIFYIIIIIYFAISK